MALRKIGSALFRGALATSVRSVRPSMMAVPVQRALFSADAGYMEKSVVTERVLEVVRKFEKVCYINRAIVHEAALVVYIYTNYYYYYY